MALGNGNLDDRRILQRACREGVPFQLQNGRQTAKAELREEKEDGLIFRLGGRELEALGLKVGDAVQMSFEERGRQYQGVSPVASLVVDEFATLVVNQPRALSCLNPEAFLDVVPERWIRGTYTTVGHDLLDGRASGFSEAGIEMEWLKGKREDFRLGVPLAFSLELAPDLKPELQGVPAYFTDKAVGLRVQGAKDPQHLEKYRAWVRDRLHESRERDRLDFSRDGFTSQKDTLEARKPVVKALEILSDRDPLVLVVAEDESLAHHLAQVLGRKFGIGYLDYLMGTLRPQLVSLEHDDPWGRFRLILVHHRLRVASGYELIRQVVQKENCPLPVLLVGSAEDLDLKRNRAIAAGAVDFMAVEPFHVISIMRQLEETIRMFG